MVKYTAEVNATAFTAYTSAIEYITMIFAHKYL